jgi:hypothetical protein
MNGAEFLFTLIADGLLAIVVGLIWRWVFPERFTVRRLLVLAAVIAVLITAFRLVAVR